MKSIILSMVAATALLSGCADSKTQPVPESPLTSNDHQITLKIDTVRTDLPDSSPVCLNGMNIYESLSERHPGLFAKNQNVIFRSAFFDDGQAISSETIRKIMQSTPCVESQTTSAGSWEPGFAPIFPDICYHLTHYKPAAADIPVASDNPAHYADAIRYNARTPLQGSLLPLTRLVWA